LPCDVRDGSAFLNGVHMVVEGPVRDVAGSRTELGIRPEFVTLADSGIAARLRKVSDVGRHKVVEAIVGDTIVSAIVSESQQVPDGEVFLQFAPEQTRVYADGWLATEKGATS